jgi:hypothetical protein
MLTADEFRRIALSLPEAIEGSHMRHPDFRVGGKIFATLGVPDDGWGMVKLTPAQQESFVEAGSGAFVPVKGGWGVRGATNVCLEAAKAKNLQAAIETAWRNVAPKKLLAKLKDVNS